MHSINNTIFYFFNHFAGLNTYTDELIRLAANDLAIFTIAAAIIFLLFHSHTTPSGPLSFFARFRAHFKESTVVLFSAVSAWLVVYILKIVFSAPRPFIAITDVYLIVQEIGNDSFPSGHATFFAALATALFFYHRRAGTMFAVAAVLIGVARITAGVHFPGDILAGWSLGILVAVLARIIVVRPEKNLAK